MTARHCTPAHDCNQQRRAQKHRTDYTLSTLSQSLSALTLQHWNKQLRQARPQDLCRTVTSAQHGLPATAAAAADNMRPAPLSHYNAVVTHACAHRSGTHAHTRAINRKKTRSVAHSRIRHSETRCSYEHATQSR